MISQIQNKVPFDTRVLNSGPVYFTQCQRNIIKANTKILLMPGVENITLYFS